MIKLYFPERFFGNVLLYQSLYVSIRKKLIRFLLTSLVILSFSVCCPGQSNPVNPADWENILTQHESGVIDDTTYLIKTQKLVEQSFRDPDLKEKMNAYQKIAWSNAAYQPYRVKYFAFLANHATFAHQEGYAIYYLQKMEEELKKTKPYVNSLNEPRLLLYIYGSTDLTNHDKRIRIIEDVLPFLRSMPQLLIKQDVSINTCINALTILRYASRFYMLKKDSSKVFEMVNLSKAIVTELEKKPGMDEEKMELCRMSLYMSECAGAQMLHDRNEEQKVLNRAYNTITSKNSKISPLFQRPFELTLLRGLIDFHIDQNQRDSINYYFSRFKERETSFSQNEFEDGTTFLLYSGKIDAGNERYKQAYQKVLRAYEIHDSVMTVKMADIHNNMYAHMVSEQRSEELVEAEIQKGNRNTIIFVVSIVLLITTAFFLVRLRTGKEKARREMEELNRATQRQIEEINETARGQIAELEAKADRIQKKMGMELHDDIAARLASICNLVESRIFDEKDLERKKQLEAIGEIARDAYTTTRLKSHEWYSLGIKEEQIAFLESIFKIVEQALPEGKYEKQIEIDEHSLEQVSPEIQIHLLRIIQEGVTNVLKHANASKVDLFIYEDSGAINLQISDNGVGFDPETVSKSSTFGLQSLKNRVREINGSLEIISSPKGTDLLFCIPVGSDFSGMFFGVR